MTLNPTSDRRRPKILVLGLRGFPNVQGGVETHAENLYPRLVEHGFDIEVIVRSPYASKQGATPQIRGIKFTSLFAPRSRGLEAIVHTWLGVLFAAWYRPDVLHIHAIGPALFAPAARLFGLKVVTTHHGHDYQREKWGRVAKAILRLGEWAGARFSNAQIAVSQTIADAVRAKHGAHCTVIRNGVTLVATPRTVQALERLHLQPGAYVLMVGRLVAEKRQPDLIEAFRRASLPGWKLVLVGGADHQDDYTHRVRQLIAETPNVVAAGVVTGEPLRELYANAGVFVLPSSHEGLPIALLEALSFGLPCVASDIAPNREVPLPNEQYFDVGDVDALAEKLKHWSSAHIATADRDAIRESLDRDFNWDRSAEQTARVLRCAISATAAVKAYSTELG